MIHSVRAAARCLLPVAAVLLLGLSGPAAASPSGVVISQFRVDGPSGGNDEFIEILNTGSSSASIGGWQLQGCASGSGAPSTRVTVSAGKTLAAGQYYLFTNSASGGYSGTVAGDQTYSTGISNSGKTGIRLLDASSTVQDGVGLSGSTCAEGTALSSLASTAPNNAFQRKSGGTQDTDSNAADFGAAGAANPHNSGGAGGGGCANTGLRIYTVQGAKHLSPYAGQCVAALPGIVTQVAGNGFYMQDPDGDGNPNTSDGIFVFTSAAPGVTAGQGVSVDGTVSEYRPQGATNLSTTEIDTPTVSALASSPFTSGTVLPTVIGAGGRVPPNQKIDSVSEASVESVTHAFDPASNGIDFFESLEGMLVQVNNPRAIAPTKSKAFWVTADDGANATGVNAHGGLSLVDRGGSDGVDYNPERIEVYPGLSTLTPPAVNVGDHLSTITGVLSYYYNPEIDYAVAPTVTPGSLQKGVSSLSTGSGRLTIGTYNLENLDANDSDTCDGGPDKDVANGRFATEGQHIVHNLGAPDILGVEEIQDNNGCVDDGTVDGSTTLDTVVQNIVAAGGPHYSYVTVTPDNDTDGGIPGGNIRQAILYNPARVTFVPGTLGAGTSQQATSLVNTDGQVQLTYSPGRIDPTNAAWNTSRKPLAATFEFNGRRVLLIVNHFNSKGGDGPLWGVTQPPVLSSETQRIQQAQVEHDFVQQALSLQPTAHVVAVGDYNDFDFSNPMKTLTGASAGQVILSDLATLLLAPEERYSYVFDGNSQELDHIYVTDALLPNAQVQPVHVNSEFADQVSDHDPTLASFAITPPNQTPNAFSFAAFTGAELSSTHTSNSVTIGGLEIPAALTVSGGAYVLNGAAASTAPATVKNGDTLALVATASASYSTTVTATAQIGPAFSAGYSLSTRDADTTPDPFAFSAVTNADLGTVYTSDAITVSGLEVPAVISVSGGSFSVNGGVFSSIMGTVQDGDQVRVQLTSAVVNSVTVSATLSIGGVSASYQVTTRVADDSTPDALNFTKITGAEPATAYTSDPVTVSGINVPAPISVSAGTYSINGGAFTAAPGTIKAGDALRLRITSSSSFKTAIDAKVNVGGVKGYFELKTRPADTTPDALTFTTISAAAPSTLYTSNAAAIGGIEVPVAISIVNGAYSINNGPFTSAAGTVQGGDSIRLQTTSSASAATQVYATVTVGAGKGYFRVRTR